MSLSIKSHKIAKLSLYNIVHIAFRPIHFLLKFPFFHRERRFILHITINTAVETVKNSIKWRVARKAQGPS